MKFDWDDQKNELNLLKHGMQFSDIRQLFWSPSTTFGQAGNESGEQRYYAVGLLPVGLVKVIFVNGGM